ncbi:hypothetical protein [Flavobacterium olei]|uniref:hypothetical protein n=1 Tax=Flavobacterium olei TaxID=1886782 RepID=UPI00321909C9
MQAVSPWATTAQTDIEINVPLLTKEISGYTFEVFNSGDSIWIVSKGPKNERFGFRVAFALNSFFEVEDIVDDENKITINLKSGHGKYEVYIDFPKTDIPPLLHYKTTFTANQALLIPYWPKDVIPLTDNGIIENTIGKIHVHQVGTRTGLIFASVQKPKKCTLFYFQNLSSMSEYCEATKTSLGETVGGTWPEIGFNLPKTMENPIPAGKKFVISDAYVLLGDELKEDPSKLCAEYLENLAQIYMVIPHPETEYHEWTDIVQKTSEHLYNNKGCWTQTKGFPYLNAYLTDYETPAESMVQLAVLIPLKEYEKWDGAQSPISRDLAGGISAFYDPKINCITRWHPALQDKLDQSEEQKKDTTMDSWYLHHPLINLTRLALDGNKEAKELVVNSIDFVIKAAHHFKYEWPVFYNVETFEVIKEETEPGKGGEKDVPGAYAHLMLLVYKLTKDKKFLNEAEKAAKQLTQCGFDIFYQANNTAFAANALLELYKITGEKIYLDTSYMCLAGVFKNVQVWDCQYGFGKNYANYFSVFPLNDAPYCAAYEEMEVYAALTEYMIQAKDVEILPALRVLIPEFVKYAVNRIPYYFPSLLPEDMLSEEVKTGEIQKDLWIPLEDLYTGWEQSGQVGQEVYGVGSAFAIVPRQYIKANDDFMIFIDYPVTNYTKRKDTVTIRIDGNENMNCDLKIIKRGTKKINAEVTQKRKAVSPFKKSADMHEYKISGQGTITVKF